MSKGVNLREESRMIKGVLIFVSLEWGCVKKAQHKRSALVLGMRLGAGSREIEGELKVDRQSTCFPGMSVLCVSREYLLELGDGIKQQVRKRRLGGKGLYDPQVSREEKKGCRKGSAAETKMRLMKDWIWRRGGIREYLLLACLLPWPALLVCLQGMPLAVGGWRLGY